MLISTHLITDIQRTIISHVKFCNIYYEDTKDNIMKKLSKHLNCKKLKCQYQFECKQYEHAPNNGLFKKITYHMTSRLGVK